MRRITTPRFATKPYLSGTRRPYSTYGDSSWSRAIWLGYRDGALAVTTSGVITSFGFGVILGMGCETRARKLPRWGAIVAITTFPCCLAAGLLWPLIPVYGCWLMFQDDPEEDR
nr:hypothetical protein [Pandoravirus massiliensis]